MKSKGILLLASLMLTSSMAMAAVTDEEFDANCRGEFKEMSDKLDTLADENQELREQNEVLAQSYETSGAAVTETWTDRIGISGDFRYRYENIDDEEGRDERNRSRISARAAITGLDAQ